VIQSIDILNFDSIVENESNTEITLIDNRDKTEVNITDDKDKINVLIV